MLELGPPTLCKPVASPFLLLAAAWGCHLILGTWLISGHLVGEPQCPYRMRQTFPLFTSGQQDGFSSMNFPVATWAPCEAYTSSSCTRVDRFPSLRMGSPCPAPTPGRLEACLHSPAERGVRWCGLVGDAEDGGSDSCH